MFAQGKKQLETRVHNYKNFHPSTISTGKIFMGMKQNRILFCLDEYPCRAVVRTIAFKSEGHINQSYYPRFNPWKFHKKILRIGNFEKCPFFESAILNFFFQKKIFFCFFPMKNKSKFIG